MKYWIGVIGLISLASLVFTGLIMFAWEKSESEALTERLMLEHRANTAERDLRTLESELEELGHEVQKLRYIDYQVDKLRRDFHSGSTLVDFTTTDIQELSGLLYLARASQEEHLTGLRFKGRIINGSALDRENIKLTLKQAYQGDKEKSFTINRISSGNSTSFSVYLPDISAKDFNHEYIQVGQSSFHYLAN